MWPTEAYKKRSRHERMLHKVGTLIIQPITNIPKCLVKKICEKIIQDDICEKCEITKHFIQHLSYENIEINKSIVLLAESLPIKLFQIGRL